MFICGYFVAPSSVLFTRPDSLLSYHVGGKEGLRAGGGAGGDKELPKP